MSIPATGTYLADDGAFKIQIDTVDSGKGKITGVYEAQNSPIGLFKDSGDIGNFNWVFSDAAGRDGVAPFTIRFVTSARPADRKYSIIDLWTGYYTPNNSMVLSGVRAFVNSEGATESVSLGTHTFDR